MSILQLPTAILNRSYLMMVNHSAVKYQWSEVCGRCKYDPPNMSPSYSPKPVNMLCYMERGNQDGRWN